MEPAATAETTTPAEPNRLLTGVAYLDSLRDGRTVYLEGERVADVTRHRAFRNAARSVARLYDTLHDPALAETLTAVDAFGIRTHKFFKPSGSAQELLEAREAIAVWARLSYGFMGRTPDYKAAFMASLGANPDFYAPFDGNALAWYQRYAALGLFFNHTLVNPPVDRKRPVHEVADVFVHVTRETDGGIIVSGAKMLATGSALTHATFVAQHSATQLQPGRAEDFALVFIAPMDTPGVTLICRPSYEASARSPFDHPLSSRFDENDAVLIFEEAFIPGTEHAAALRLFAPRCWPAVTELFELNLGASLLVTPSSVQDLLTPELRPLIDRFYRGSDSSVGVCSTVVGGEP